MAPLEAKPAETSKKKSDQPMKLVRLAKIAIENGLVEQK